MIKERIIMVTIRKQIPSRTDKMPTAVSTTWAPAVWTNQFFKTWVRFTDASACIYLPCWSIIISPYRFLRELPFQLNSYTTATCAYHWMVVQYCHCLYKGEMDAEWKLHTYLVNYNLKLTATAVTCVHTNHIGEYLASVSSWHFGCQWIAWWLYLCKLTIIEYVRWTGWCTASSSFQLYNNVISSAPWNCM